MIITHALLREKHACARALGVFAREWPNGAEVTIENCLRATHLGLSISWAAQNLLPATQWAEYVIQGVRIDADYWLKAGPSIGNTTANLTPTMKRTEPPPRPSGRSSNGSSYSCRSA